LTVHSLGGGSLVIIPGEADFLEIVRPIPHDQTDEIFEQIDICVKTKSIKDAYRLGDELVLKGVFGMTDEQIAILQECVETIRKWRTPSLRRKMM
jgi:hypothetical protein